MSKHHGLDATPPAPANPLRRRGLLAGAGAAGAAGLAATALPGGTSAVPEVAAAAAKPAGTSAGYQLTAHVLRYYETTRS